MYNFLLYIIVFAIVVWSLDGLNLNHLFKQNRVFEARVFYIILAFSLTYLSSNFILNFLNSFK
jgi:uncharacterized membrane protein YwzB